MKGKWRSLFKFQLLKTLEFTSPRIWHIVKLCDIELSPLAPLPVGALRERWERGSEDTLKANGDHLLIPHYIENPNISLILWNSTQLPFPPGVLWGGGVLRVPLKQMEIIIANPRIEISFDIFWNSIQPPSPPPPRGHPLGALALKLVGTLVGGGRGLRVQKKQM